MLCLCASIAFGHAGNAGLRVEQEARVEIGEGGILVEYTTEFNRQAVYLLEVLRMDRDGDGGFSADEHVERYMTLPRATLFLKRGTRSWW